METSCTFIFIWKSFEIIIGAISWNTYNESYSYEEFKQMRRFSQNKTKQSCKMLNELEMDIKCANQL
jgi:hypothetical protein